MKNHSSYENFVNTLLLLSKRRTAHKIILGSTNKVLLDLPNDKTKTISFTDNVLKYKDLHLIKRTKKELLANYEKVPISNFPNQKRIGVNFINQEYKYIYLPLEKQIAHATLKFKNVEPTELDFMIDNCIEVDIEKAYLSVCKQFHLLSEKLYQDLFNLSDKTIRMVAIGAMAAVKKQYYPTGVAFDGKNFSEAYQFEKDLTNFEGRKLFFFLQNYVSSIIIECLEGLDWYFFWVDQAYLPQDDADIFKERLEKKGFNIHSNRVELIGTTKNTTIVVDEKETRYFPLQIK